MIALKESPERRAPLEMCLEHRDPLVLRERQVLRENQEWMERQDNPVIQDHREFQEMMAHRVNQDHREHQANRTMSRVSLYSYQN